MDVEDDLADQADEEWDKDCVIISDLELRSAIKGYHYPSLIREKYVPPERPMKLKKPSLSLRSALTTTAFFENFAEHWSNDQHLTNDDVHLLEEPFKVCVVNRLLEEENILTKVRDEFNEIEWNKRNLDLYEFFQSKDLSEVDSFYISFVYDFLKSEVKSWLQDLTKLDLTKISATCSLYGHTDHLLVHDDLEGNRAIAFVFYFTGPTGWEVRDGGALQLYGKDTAGEPSKVIRNVYPRHNQFVFFQVSNSSYHQVEEILNRDDCRMSINGWFHNDLPLDNSLPTDSSSIVFSDTFLTPKVEDLDLESWIYPCYLQADIIKSIQEQIEEESEIALHNFIKADLWQDVVNCLHSPDINWNEAGPPNRRSCFTLSEDNVPETLRRFINLFLSQQMFDLLTKYTDLDLQYVRYELQKWTPQCYSLLTDYDWSKKQELDLIVYLGLPEVTCPVVGGKTMYICPEEVLQSALITLDPHENRLNIVYRDSGRITKYVSKCSKAQMFFVLICSYSE